MGALQAFSSHHPTGEITRRTPGRFCEVLIIQPRHNSIAIEPEFSHLHQMGRPSKYTDEILQEICSRLSEGEPLEQICRSDHMPASNTVWTWANTEIKGIDKTVVSEAIARARDVGYDVIAANLRDIARGTHKDSSGDVQRDKLIVDTDLKLLAKWSPKKYGDKTAVEHSGEVSLKDLILGSMKAEKKD